MRQFPSAINAIPNSNSEIQVAKDDVAQPAYGVSKAYQQLMNTKTITSKPQYSRIDLAFVSFKKLLP